MAFALSPGVTVVEKDFSTIIPAVSTSTGAFAGAFAWGPVLEPTTISSENELVQRFGRPNDQNFKSFFTAANFLSYSANLLVNRVETAGMRNAASSATGEVITVDFSGTNAGFRPGHNATVTFSAPQSATGTTATGTVVLKGSTIAGFTITQAGSGYLTAPTVTISSPDVEGGEQAFAVAEIGEDGEVTAINLVANPNDATATIGGSGYLTATVAISAAPAGGVSATATATVPASQISHIDITNGGSGYTAAPTATIAVSDTATYGVPTIPTTTAVISLSAGAKILNSNDYLANYADLGVKVHGMFAAKYPGILGNGLQVVLVDNNVYTWAVANEESNSTASLITTLFGTAPGTSDAAGSKGISNDELHVIVLDSAQGTWSGVPNGVLETFSFLSKIKGVTRPDGTNTYFRDSINNGSKYLWVLSTPSSEQVVDMQNADWNQHIDTIAFGTNLRDLEAAAQVLTLTGGADDYNATFGSIMNGYRMFQNAETYDISLVPLGDASPAIVNAVLADLVDQRRDCVLFCSIRGQDGGPLIATGDAGVQAAKAFKANITNSNYLFMDSGWKYQYDRYNDEYRWVPLNGDIAGLCARTDLTNDPWFSPGGFTRGQIKNVIKLGFNPGKTERDNLYKESVNPVVTFPGQGTILYGDKTFTSKPSAFDRINVRRLFIVLEKAISTAAKFQLFEFNDDFTRAMFKNMVEPFLRNVQGRRGIIDFRVKCDDTNNTGEVIDRNEFVADIFIKPNRSINFITLNFVAARTSVNFTEIGG